MSNTSPRTFDYDQKLSGLGFRLPARMTVLPLAAGKLAVISPIPMDDALATEVTALGEVAYLIAPNLLHHLYMKAASQRFPEARVLAPRGLRKKRPDLRIDGELGDPLPSELTDALEVLCMEGAPVLGEYVFFHRESRTLVVTDLVFNVVRPRGLVAHLVLYLVGCHGRLAQSRVLRMLFKDRAAAARSVQQLLALPFETLVMAHGELVRERARDRLTVALAGLSSMPRHALTAGGSVL